MANTPASENDNTPLQTPNSIQELRNLVEEVRLLRLETYRTIHTLEKDIPQLQREIARVQLFHQWFPTMVIAAAVVARLLWLR